MIEIITKDGSINIDLEESNIEMSQHIKQLLETYEKIEKISLESINLKTMNKILDFTRHHKTDQLVLIMNKPIPPKILELGELVNPWYTEYLNIKPEDLFALLHAANFLMIDEIINLICTKITIITKNNEPKQIRETFAVSGYTDEEKKECATSKNWTVSS